MRHKDKIIHEARSWIGTAFMHQGRMKKSDGDSGACDCLGLILGVANACNIVSRATRNPLSMLDEKNYSSAIDDVHLKNTLKSHLIEKPVAEVTVGDVLLFTIAKTPRHLGILSSHAEYLTLIHSYNTMVTEHIFDAKWRKRLSGVYAFYL